MGNPMSVPGDRRLDERLFPPPRTEFRRGRPTSVSLFMEKVRDFFLVGAEEEHPRDFEFTLDQTGRHTCFETLQIEAHSPAMLSQALQVLIRGQDKSGCFREGVPSPNRNHEEAIAEFDRKYHLVIDNIKDTLLEDERLMMDFYDIFDDLFFGSCMRGLSAIRFEKETDMPNILGDCTSQRHPFIHRMKIPHGSEILIRIIDLSSTVDVSCQDPRDRWISYLGTLLHETIRGFFEIFSYTCEIASCHGSYLRELGPSGHGKSWQELALAIEEAALAFLKFDIDLGRLGSFRLEVVSGGKRASYDVITGYRFRPEEAVGIGARGCSCPKCQEAPSKQLSLETTAPSL